MNTLYCTSLLLYPQSGISLGVMSLLSTWLLLAVVFFMYAAASVMIFSKNDPYHFGSVAMSMWTYFEMSTLDVSISL